MSATIIPFPPQYRIAWDNGHTTGYVQDEDTGRDWITRHIDEATSLMDALKSYYPHIIFWREQYGA